jgi:WD40 repeat protein
VLILQGPDHPVQALTFSPDATTLYIVQGHHGIRAWNVINRTANRLEIDGRLLVRQFVFHPGGRWAFSATAHTTPPAHNMARLIDLSAGTMRPFNFTGQIRDTVACLSDGSRVVTIGSSEFEVERPPRARGRTRLYGWTMTASGPEYAWHRDVPTGEQVLFTVALDDQFATADFVRPKRASYDTAWDARITIHRASDGLRVAELPHSHGPIQQLLAAPDGGLLVTRVGTELRAWTASDWKAPPPVVAGDLDHEMEPAAASFHPSGRYLLLATNGPTVIAFDTATWAPVQRWKWDVGALLSTAVSPDGTLAAAGSARGTVVVWDLDL